MQTFFCAHCGSLYQTVSLDPDPCPCPACRMNGFEERLNVEAADLMNEKSLEGKPISREEAFEGLGDPADWPKEYATLYEEFKKKPAFTHPPPLVLASKEKPASTTMGKEEQIENAKSLIWRNCPTHPTTFSACERKCGRGSGRGGGPCLTCAIEDLAALVGIEAAFNFAEAVRFLRQMENVIDESIT